MSFKRDFWQVIKVKPGCEFHAQADFHGFVADDVGHPGPGRIAVSHLAELKQRFRVHREGAVVIHQLNKVGRGRVQRDF